MSSAVTGHTSVVTSCGIPLTTANLCTQGGGQVTDAAPGVQRCTGGGDTGDIIISEEQAKLLVQTVPRPPVQTPPLPSTP